MATRETTSGLRAFATERKLLSAATGVAAASLARVIGSELNSYRKLHRLTRALAAEMRVEATDGSSAGPTASGQTPPTTAASSDLNAIEQAARGCGVFHRRTTNPPAVEICLDSHIWAITPDPAGTGWLARCCDVKLRRDRLEELWLPRTTGESAVPTLAWGRLLSGAPLRAWAGDTVTAP